MHQNNDHVLLRKFIYIKYILIQSENYCKDVNNTILPAERYKEIINENEKHLVHGLITSFLF